MGVFMRCQYVIQPDDTFEKIAIQFYNNPVLAEKLRHYNGLYNPAVIIVGQPIDIPAKLDLHGTAADQNTLSQPQGYQQILDFFGNIYDFFDEDGCFDETAWCAEMITTAKLPFPVALSWDHSRQIRKVRCHKRMAGIISDVFYALQQEGFANEIITLGDFYNFRSKRSTGKLSPHCWGIAFDINPEINLLGSKGCMPDDLVGLLGDFGFTWGGDISGKHRDPMHFQFGIGY